jgi:NAD(P)-dependent dehydrogenase (short-subunit alcohol dehydrogenase family)
MSAYAWSTSDIPSLAGTTAVVTGANSGIGWHTAAELARHGADVTLAVRSLDKGEAAAAQMREGSAGTVRVARLDLGSLASVQEFAEAWDGPLGLLVNNAGLMSPPRYRETADGHELQFGTNHLGHFLLVGRLLPLLEAGAPARVVLLSSGGHAASDIIWDDPNFEAHDYSKMEAYGQSKTANILHAVELDRRYGPLGVHAYAVHPGMVATDLGRHFTREDYEELKERAKAAPTGKLPPRVGVDVGAATSVWAVVAPELEAQGGTYLADCAVAEARPYATDPDAARRLWVLSEELVGESFPDPSAESDD